MSLENVCREAAMKVYTKTIFFTKFSSNIMHLLNSSKNAASNIH